MSKQDIVDKIKQKKQERGSEFINQTIYQPFSPMWNKYVLILKSIDEEIKNLETQLGVKWCIVNTANEEILESGFEDSMKARIHRGEQEFLDKHQNINFGEREYYVNDNGDDELYKI